MRAAAAAVLVAIMALAASCGDDNEDDDADTPTPTPRVVLPTAVTTAGAGEEAMLDGESLVVVRTLPAAALSADQLEPAGFARGPGDAPLAMARPTGSGDVQEWELVSPADDGWRVWQPRAVNEAASAAGDGASVVEVERVDWPDACLGAARPDEVCAQVITAGYRVVIDVGGRRVEYHTDLRGNVREAP